MCFQFAPEGVSEPLISDLNRELLHRLHETGFAVPSYTELNGKFAIRAVLTNHRTTNEDIELLVQEVVRIGSQLSALDTGARPVDVANRASAGATELA